MNTLEIEHLSKSFTIEDIPAVDNISLSLEQGKLLALLGESGSGKTTLLRLIAGLEKPDSGSITLNGELVCNDQTFIKPEHRNIGFVFQNHALFPHLTVSQNIAFGIKGKTQNQKKEIIEKNMLLVGLPGLEERYPHQLSGGQQQRVALARALAPNPNIILLDEPFSNLDNVLKDQVRDDIRNIIKKAGATAIFVTHDIYDALQTADEIALIQNGQLIQKDTPYNIYYKPLNEMVGGFFGKINTITIDATTTPCRSEIGNISQPVDFLKGKSGKLLFRPDQVKMVKDGPFKGMVHKIQFLGEYNQVEVDAVTTSNSPCKITLKVSPKEVIGNGQIIHFNIDFSHAVFLDDNN